MINGLDGKLTPEQLKTMQRYPVMLYIWLGLHFAQIGCGILALIAFGLVAICFIALFFIILFALI